MSGNRTRSGSSWDLARDGAVGFALAADPTGDGFTRGLNRLTGFVGWQGGGDDPRAGAWLSARGLPRGDRLRWLARVPGWWALLLVLGIAILIASAHGPATARRR
jgi:hypothetical protein